MPTEKNERFVIEINEGSFQLANTPYNSGEDLMLTNNNFDFWTEPGVLLSNQTWVTSRSSLANAAVDPRILDIAKVYTDTTYPYYAATSSSLKTLIVKRTSANNWDNQILSTVNGSWASTPRPLVEFNGDLFTTNGGSNLLQFDDYAGGSPVETSRNFASDVTGANLITDIIVAQEYMYVSYLVAAGTFAGRIARYDGTTDINGAGMTITSITLDDGFSPVGMAQWGDYIAITATKTFNSSITQGALESKLYIWDGISNHFDAKISINDKAIQAPYIFNGDVWLFCAGRLGTVRVYKWSGGRNVSPVTTFNINSGLAADINIRKAAMTDNGKFIMFAPYGATGARAWVYAVNDSQKAILYTFEEIVDNIQNIYCLKNFGDTSFVSFMEEDANVKYLLETNSIGTWGQDMTFRTPQIYPSKNKQFKIDTIRYRHSDLGAGDTTTMAYNGNQASTSRYTFTGTNLFNKTYTATAAGLGSGVEEVRTFSNPQGPIMDGAQFFFRHTPSVADATQRPRIILPIVIEGEILNTPR